MVISMKVGIATVHDSSNLGSFLQALGMQELVLQNGDEPVFIKTRSSFTTLCLYLGYNNAPPVRSLKGFLGFVFHSLKSPGRIKQRYKKYLTYKKDWKCFKKLVPAGRNKKLDLDVLLLGSDEIWNTRRPAFQNPLLYGIGISAKHKYGYAISVGDMPINGWDKYPELIDGIRKLDGILIRDEHTREALEHYQVPVAVRICDPTLQVDIRKYMKPESEVQIPRGDYIAVYSYCVNEKTKQVIKAFAKKNNLKTVAVSLQQDWCDEYANCSPLEFGAVLCGAKYVYTSTFHGTIFSALYHTKFVVAPSGPKVFDVLELLGLSDLIVQEDFSLEQFSEKMLQNRDYKAVEKRIVQVREESKDFYQEYIKACR